MKISKLAFLALFFLPILAYADEAPAPDAGNIFAQALEAIANKNWFLLASLAMTVTIIVLRRYVFAKDGFFGTKKGGYVMNLGIAILTSLGISLAGHGGEAFTLAALGTVGLAVLKSSLVSTAVYVILQDVFGFSASADAKEVAGK